MYSDIIKASGAKTRQAPLFKKRRKRIEVARPKNAITFESMELSQ